MMHDAEKLIADLELIAHPEGGYYRETYRSTASVTTADGSQRRALTNVHFLLAGDEFSAWHRIDADETWHFYRGGGLVVSIIASDGSFEERRLGPDGPWQTTVLRGLYFAAHVPVANSYALVGCSVAPGFEFSALELPSRAALTARYPRHAAEIARFTRETQ